MNIAQKLLQTRGFTVRRHYPLLPLLRANGVARIIDVGASVGQFRNRMREEGWDGWIDSYEPIPWRYEQLRESGGPRDRSVNVALSDCAADCVFSVAHNMDASGIGESAGAKMRLMVKTQRLDALCGGADVLFLKVDAEGHDMRVIEGARGLLHRIPVIQFESGPDRLSGDLQAVERLGYRPQRLSEFSDGHGAMAFDVVVTR